MPDPRIWPIPSSVNSNAGVGADSVIILAANQRRVDADFTNDGGNVMYLARGETAVIGQGQRLNANGGSYHIGTNNLFLGDIYAISTGEGETNIAISEGVKPK